MQLLLFIIICLGSFLLGQKFEKNILPGHMKFSPSHIDDSVFRVARARTIFWFAAKWVLQKSTGAVFSIKFLLGQAKSMYFQRVKKGRIFFHRFKNFWDIFHRGFYRVVFHRVTDSGVSFSQNINRKFYNYLNQFECRKYPHIICADEHFLSKIKFTLSSKKERSNRSSPNTAKS